VRRTRREDAEIQVPAGMWIAGLDRPMARPTWTTRPAGSGLLSWQRQASGTSTLMKFVMYQAKLQRRDRPSSRDRGSPRSGPLATSCIANYLSS
jgi:hypothetical protein